MSMKEAVGNGTVGVLNGSRAGGQFLKYSVRSVFVACIITTEGDTTFLDVIRWRKHEIFDTTDRVQIAVMELLAGLPRIVQ